LSDAFDSKQIHFAKERDLSKPKLVC